MVNPDEGRLNEIAARLDRLAHVPSDVLAEIVLRDGLCLWAFRHGELPDLTGVDTADRELAAQLCEHCPVQDKCLVWELRLHGPDTVGVWGALPEDDRRALYPLWRACHEPPDKQEGGETPMTINLTQTQTLAGMGVVLAFLLIWRTGARQAEFPSWIRTNPPSSVLKASSGIVSPNRHSGSWLPARTPPRPTAAKSEE